MIFCFSFHNPPLVLKLSRIPHVKMSTSRSCRSNPASRIPHPAIPLPFYFYFSSCIFPKLCCTKQTESCLYVYYSKTCIQDLQVVTKINQAYANVQESPSALLSASNPARYDIANTNLSTCTSLYHCHYYVFRRHKR